MIKSNIYETKYSYGENKTLNREVFPALNGVCASPVQFFSSEAVWFSINIYANPN